MENKYTLDYIKNNNLILFECIGGSIAYGTNLPTSDIDIRGVFIAELDDVLTHKYPQQISDSTNDTTYYELGRFIELVSTNNPNILELLNSPEDCVKLKHPLFDLLIDNKINFITKATKNSFGGYTVQQIQKAKGLNKKQNIAQGSVTRKDVLDFCYVIQGEKSMPWKIWNDVAGGYEEKFVGITNVPHAKDLYAVFYDSNACNCFGEFSPQEDKDKEIARLKLEGKPLGFGYKGLAKVGGSDNAGESNQLRLSSIPKDETPICNIVYNKDAYTAHCKDYKEYMEWDKNKNTARYVDTQKHGQQIDGKNMMHCIRLLTMMREIATGLGVRVRREDREYLLSIRRGEVDLETLISIAENELQCLDELYQNSDLPNKVDPQLVNELLIKIRREFYHL